MNDCHDTSEDGQLASLSNELHPIVHDGGFTVTNGPLISPDSAHLFLNDTVKGIVYQYDFSLISGEISNRRVFMTFRPDQGYPDGMCFDIEGSLWIAMWGGARVLKVSQLGHILKEYNIPTPNVTNVCFGGVNLDRLFISTASIGLDVTNENTFLQSGSVFELKNHGTRGINSHTVKLEW
jgi:sugar lactone lactonase YvrE